ncbi:SPFH/Band 7/PHB domain protein [Candidatus Micrarchaeota archaeon]|nr:SPFH/Band 7/PHB domain protein [Candidatus Micrarchaeota archaeon]
MAFDIYSEACLPILIIGLIILGILSIRIVRPVEKGVVERLGKFHHIADPGLLLIVPLVDTVINVPTTEIRVDVDKQTVITKDNLNAEVDAIVYYRVQDVTKALYNIQDYKTAIPSLAQTTLRATIGKMSLTEANENRQLINQTVEKDLDEQTGNWGIDVIRVELQKIDPPEDVQEAMNNVVKAENEKRAAIDLATAAETKADGEKRASVKVAEGEAKAIELRAQAEAKAIQLVNEAAQKYFKGDAQTLKKLEVAEKALSQNTKYIIPEGTSLSAIISETAGIIPVPEKKQPKKE